MDQELQAALGRESRLEIDRGEVSHWLFVMHGVVIMTVDLTTMGVAVRMDQVQAEEQVTMPEYFPGRPSATMR